MDFIVRSSAGCRPHSESPLLPLPPLLRSPSSLRLRLATVLICPSMTVTSGSPLLRGLSESSSSDHEISQSPSHTSFSQ